MGYIEDYASARDLTRGPLDEIRTAAIKDGRDIIADAWSYFDRSDDIESVRGKALQRFGVGIRRGDGTASEDTSRAEDYDTYERTANKAKIINGHMEIISTSFGIRVGRIRANLFNSPTQRYEYLSDNDEQDEIVAETVKLIRDVGGYDTTIETADYAACCLGSAAVHVYFKGEQLQYDTLLPQDVYLVFPRYVSDMSASGSRIMRAVDYRDIEDAGAVIIRMATDYTETGSNSDQRWLAYVGQNEDYPDGRMVSYSAKNFWPIPAPGDDGVFDYSHAGDGAPANPLTYLGNHGSTEQRKAARCEYPIAVIDGALRSNSKEVLPTSTSLYDSSLEVELAWSRVLRSALKSARGKDVFTRGIGAQPRLPASLDVLDLVPDVQYQLLNIPASNSKDAAEVVKTVARTTSEGYDVPGYMVLAEQQGGPESGVALAIRTRPLVEARDKRIKINGRAVSKIYDIERGLLTEYTGEEIIPASVRQAWNPGRIEMPVNKAEQTAQLQAAMDAMLVDQVAAVREYAGLVSDADALALIGKYLERDAGYTFDETTQSDTVDNA